MTPMSTHDENFAPGIEPEARALISELRAAGWIVSASNYDSKSFGNWWVDLHHTGHVIRLVKDRSQYMIDGPQTEAIKAAGLWKAFDNMAEFRHAVIKCAVNSDLLTGDTSFSN